jgi:hypothetical protein
VGTPSWCQDVEVAANDPLNFENLTYALHFYAATHKQAYRNKALTALNEGISLFVSEFGTCAYTGSGAIDYDEVATWFEFMEEHKLSWCNWSVADLEETSAVLNNGASATGNWSSSDLSESGMLIRDEIIYWNESIFFSVEDISQYDVKLGYDLIQNFPNPFNSSTQFQFYIFSPQRVEIDVYNILGKKVFSLLNEQMQAGNHHILFHSDYLSSGTYFYKYETGNISQIKRMQLIK